MQSSSGKSTVNFRKWEHVVIKRFKVSPHILKRNDMVPTRTGKQGNPEETGSIFQSWKFTQNAGKVI